MVLFNFFAVIVIFPAMIVIDRSRRKSGKYDLLCCIERLVHVFMHYSCKIVSFTKECFSKTHFCKNVLEPVQ